MMHLYHGSSKLFDTLQPFQSSDWMNQAGNSYGVYATDIKDVALAFCLGGKKDKEGNLSRTIEFLNDGKIRMAFIEGTPNLGGRGYLYTLKKDDFEKVSAHQWVSNKSVKPLKIEEIEANNSAYLSRYGGKQEIAKERRARAE